MEIRFGNLTFTLKNDKLLLTECGLTGVYPQGFVEVHIAGEHKFQHAGIKLCVSSEGARLKYVSHDVTHNADGDVLTITQASGLVSVTSVFKKFSDADAVSVYTSVKNISESDIVLEEVASLVLPLAERYATDTDALFFTRFIQGHHTECQPRRASFADWGLFKASSVWHKKIYSANIGSQSTKEELPQGILEYSPCGKTLMFQIESNSGWYYEMSNNDFGNYYLYLGGANLPYGGWAKKLAAGQVYSSPVVALSFGAGVDDAIANMTAYRRHIVSNSISDRNLPVIFNEYMHLSWDSPTEENTAKIAPLAAKAGAEYYVIDCGWHNEEPGDRVYPYVGQWKESHARFPSGLKKTMDYIRSLGLKPGLWIEPEIVGILCKDMLSYYDDDCFMQRFGKKIAVGDRYFLDFRNKKVVDYLDETIRRMVEDYGAEYIKFDYNQDCGVGTDYLSFCAGEGLELCADAFLTWVKKTTARFPNVVFEACASGGMRCDHKTLSAFSLVSTSDQTNAFLYPYIAGNILSAVVPEQAAVWSYPVNKLVEDFELSDESTALNMVNSLLGRMHLASDLSKLSDKQFALVKEGVDYYNYLSADKKKAVPVFPKGFTRFGAKETVAGLKCGNKIYLAVWNLSKSARTVSVNLKNGVKTAKVGYPVSLPTAFDFAGSTLNVDFKDGQYARFFEIEII